MGALLRVLIGVANPLAVFKKLKNKNASLQNSDIALAIVKTIGFWGLLIIILFAMSKGVFSVDDVDGLIKTIKE